MVQALLVPKGGRVTASAWSARESRSESFTLLIGHRELGELLLALNRSQWLVCCFFPS